MGLSSSKSKTTTNQQTSETGSTVPVNPPWVTEAIEEYTGRLGAFGDMDPNQFIAGPSPLQTMAWNSASSLSDWQPQAKLASQHALAAAEKPANLAGPAETWSAAQGHAATYSAPALRDAAQVSASTWEAPKLGPAALGSASTYSAPTLGNAATYQAPSAGTAATYAAPALGAAS